jgi:hypothetical protein
MQHPERTPIVARKITEQAVTALLRGERFNSSNTTVDVAGDVATMSLHGNPIAVVNIRTRVMLVSTGEWETTTTKERLNGLPFVQVHTAKHVLHLNGKPWDHSDKWTVVGDVGLAEAVDRAHVAGVRLDPAAVTLLDASTLHVCLDAIAEGRPVETDGVVCEHGAIRLATERTAS